MAQWQFHEKHINANAAPIYQKKYKDKSIHTTITNLSKYNLNVYRNVIYIEKHL